MSLIRPVKTISVNLNKDLIRSIKRGHAWLFSDAIDLPQAASGSIARVIDRKGEAIASGIYSREHPIAVRICRTEKPYALDDAWIMERLEAAIQLRTSFFDQQTTGYRVIAGEGDCLPGLIVDRYADVAVIKLDGGAPEDFYDADAIGKWLAQRLNLFRVIHRPRGRGTSGRSIYGPLPTEPITFLENGMLFTADVVHGQKTGFFLDQRDNRWLVKSLANNRTVLNLFSFSGGFSIAAGMGGAQSVTSVDVAAPAIRAASDHWLMNNLPGASHQGIVADCFEYLEAAQSNGQRWHLVICDPPSFAPSQQTQSKALAAYSRLAQLSASVVEPGGLLALASCSSHVDAALFTQANLEGIGKARRVAQLIADHSLPIDHPTPLAMPELRYLKFQLFQLRK